MCSSLNDVFRLVKENHLNGYGCSACRGREGQGFLLRATAMEMGSPIGARCLLGVILITPSLRSQMSRETGSRIPDVLQGARGVEQGGERMLGIPTMKDRALPYLRGSSLIMLSVS